MSDSIDRPVVSRIPAAESFDNDLRLAMIDGNASGTAKKPLKSITKAQLQAFVQTLIPELPEPVEERPAFTDMGTADGGQDLLVESGAVQKFLIPSGGTTFTFPSESEEGDTIEIWGRSSEDDTMIALTSYIPEIAPYVYSILLDENEIFMAKFSYVFGQWNMTQLLPRIVNPLPI